MGRGRQTKPFNGPQYRPLIQVQAEDSAVPAQTLPSGIVFAAEERAPYVPGTNKQQYLRGPQTNGPQYIPLIQVQAEESVVPAQTLPSGIVFAGDERAPYVPGTNKRQYLRSPVVLASEDDLEDYVLLTPKKVSRPATVARQPFRAAEEAGQPQAGLFPGVSSRPSFPPGFGPRQFSAYSQAAADQGYNGPKKCLYFFK